MNHQFFRGWIYILGRASPAPPAMARGDYQTVVSEIPQNSLHCKTWVGSGDAASFAVQLNDLVDEVTALPLRLSAEQLLSNIPHDGSGEGQTHRIPRSLVCVWYHGCIPWLTIV
jgi:hypothetical protein